MTNTNEIPLELVRSDPEWTRSEAAELTDVQALEECLEHWQRNVKRCEYERMPQIWGTQCAICMKYSSCDYCPLYYEMDEKPCSTYGTDYYKLSNMPVYECADSDTYWTEVKQACLGVCNIISRALAAAKE